MTDEAPHFNKELLLALIKALDEKTTLLFNAQKDLLNEQKEGVKTAMEAAEKAIAKAENAADKRFEALNELRSMASDWRTEFARQATVDLQIQGLIDKIDAVRNDANASGNRVNEVIARGTGRSDLWGLIVGGVGLVVAILAAVVAIIVKTPHSS